MQKIFILFLSCIPSIALALENPITFSIDRINDPEGREKIEVTCSENAICKVTFDYGDYEASGVIEKKTMQDFIKANNIANLSSTYDTKCSKKNFNIAWAITAPNVSKQGYKCTDSGNVPNQIIVLEGILVKIPHSELTKKQSH